MKQHRTREEILDQVRSLKDEYVKAGKADTIMYRILWQTYDTFLSLNRDELYETYGMLKAARALNAVTHEESTMMNSILVFDGINNRRNCKFD